jgi:cell division septation protein DedD
MTRAGTAFVEVEVLTPGATGQIARSIAPPPAPSITGPRLVLQAGAYGAQDNATQMKEKLRAAGIEDVYILPPDPRTALYRVRVGPIADVAAYDQLAARLQKLDIETLLVTE